MMTVCHRRRGLLVARMRRWFAGLYCPVYLLSASALTRSILFPEQLTVYSLVSYQRARRQIAERAAAAAAADR